MRTETPVTLFLKDYAPPAWLIDSVDLHVALRDDHAEVRSRLTCSRNPAATPAICAAPSCPVLSPSSRPAAT
jgi:hypothetical protein